MEVAVYTNDKDMMQLIDSNVKQYKSLKRPMIMKLLQLKVLKKNII